MVEPVFSEQYAPSYLCQGSNTYSTFDTRFLPFSRCSVASAFRERASLVVNSNAELRHFLFPLFHAYLSYLRPFAMPFYLTPFHFVFMLLTCVTGSYSPSQTRWRSNVIRGARTRYLVPISMSPVAMNFVWSASFKLSVLYSSKVEDRRATRRNNGERLYRMVRCVQSLIG